MCVCVCVCVGVCGCAYLCNKQNKKGYHIPARLFHANLILTRPSSFTQPSYQDTTSEGGNGSLAEQSTAEGVASVASETTLPSSGEHGES